MGFLWILFSDRIIANFASSEQSLTHLQTYKGWFFVGITALLLFFLVRNEIKKKNRVEAELIKAKQKAEESDQLKSAFLSNLSHEIRTPLNGILGFCELLLDESFSVEEKNIFLSNLNENSSDLLKLINDIMDISKIQENQLSLLKKEFNLNKLMDSIYADFLNSEAKRQKQNVELKLQKSEFDEELYSDPIRLTHVIQNLLHNALFFTASGTVCFGFNKLGKKIEFFVEDTGCGIDEKFHDQIFKPFFKGYNRPIGSKGFGVGLAISKGLVKLLGGNLQFTSEVGKGTRFFFEVNQNDPSIRKTSAEKRQVLG